MAQTNYTPIILYNSGTTGNTPSTSNLASGELAINYTDGKLFYKDNSSTLQVIGWKTTPTTAGGTGLTSYTAGDLPYYSSGSALSKLGIGTSGYVLESNGSAPTWVAQSTLSVGSATNATNTAITDNTSSSATWYPTIVSATTGNLPQTTSSTKLSFVPSTGTLTATYHAGAWAGSTIGTSYGGTGLTSFTANQIFYASSTSVVAQSTNLQFNGTTLTLANDLLVNGITAGRGSGGISTNTVFGNGAFANATPATGTLNAAFGDLALASISSGAANNGIGHSAGTSISSGNHNICIGYIAGNGITTGSGNVVMGSYSAGSSTLTTGGYNTNVGYNTAPSSVSITGEMIISSGNQNATGKGANTAFITPNGGACYQGNNSATWSITSDQRIKENVVTISSGLAIVNQLNPVSFDYILTKKSDVGFIAQQYQSVLPDQVVEHSADKDEIKLTGSETLYGINQNLTPYLVKAIQELSAQITSMQALLKSANVAGF